MKLMLKNVLIVDGSGWFPYWGDVVCEDGVVTYIAHGENTIMDQEASMDQIVEMGSWCLLLNCDLVIFKPPVLSTVLAPQSLVPRSLSLQNPAPSPGLCWGELSLGSSCP